MPRVSEYRIERTFDSDLAPRLRERAVPVEAVYTREEHETALREASEAAYSDGLTAGRAEAAALAMQDEAARRQGVLDAVGPQLVALLAEADAHHAALERQMAGFALAVFDRLAPDLRAGLAAGQAERAAEEAIRLAKGSATLVIQLPPDHLKSSGEALLRVARTQGLGGRVEILPDPALPPGSVQVAWDHGVMDYAFDQICDRLRAALAAAATPSAGEA